MPPGRHLAAESAGELDIAACLQKCLDAAVSFSRRIGLRWAQRAAARRAKRCQRAEVPRRQPHEINTAQMIGPVEYFRPITYGGGGSALLSEAFPTRRGSGLLHGGSLTKTGSAFTSSTMSDRQRHRQSKSPTAGVATRMPSDRRLISP